MGCCAGNQSAGARWRADNPPPLSDLGRLKSRRSFPRLGITVDPPPADATPSLDSAAARNAYTTHGARIYGAAGPAVHLAVVDGNKLVYLLHADQVPVAWSGQAGARSADQPATALCTAVGLLDAATGEWITQIQSSV